MLVEVLKILQERPILTSLLLNTKKSNIAIEAF